MRVFLTGYAGWIGSKIKAMLENKGIENYGYDCVLPYAKWAVGIPKVIEQCDTIIHCGAVSNSNAVGNELWEMNYSATKFLANSRKKGSRFIYFSSCAADEPDTQYGWSKKISEDILSAIIPFNDLVILRPFNVWGFDEHDKESPSVIHKLMTKELITLYQGYIRDFIHVDDVVKAVEFCIDNKFPKGRYEVGTGMAIHFMKFCKTITECEGVSMPGGFSVVECPVKPMRVADKECMLPVDPPRELFQFQSQIVDAMKNGHAKDKREYRGWYAWK